MDKIPHPNNTPNLRYYVHLQSCLGRKKNVEKKNNTILNEVKFINKCYMTSILHVKSGKNSHTSNPNSSKCNSTLAVVISRVLKK